VKLERTTYETEPVGSVAEAVAELAAAYNRLQNALHAEPATWVVFGEGLRTAIHKPVDISGNKGLKLSLYEIGVAYAPDSQSNLPGRLSVNDEKLTRALEDRAEELKVFFTCKKVGLLPRLCKILSEFRANSAPLDGAMDEYWEHIYPPLVRLNNECRRLQAFWGD